MDSAFSRPHTDHYCPYTVVSPSAGQSLKRTPAQFHPARLRRGLPLLIYSHAAEPRIYEASYPDAAVPLMPYLGPFHGHFMYNCVFEPALIQKRNERERQRVKCVNQGYAKLREHLPGAATDKRMSKVETLRSAIRYIKHLQRLVDEHQTPTEDVHSEEEESAHKPSLTSPPVHHHDASRDSSRT